MAMRFNVKTRRMEKIPIEELNSEKQMSSSTLDQSDSIQSGSRSRRRSRSRSRDRSRRQRTRRGFGDRPNSGSLSGGGGGPLMTLRIHGLHEGSYNGTIMLIQLRDKFSAFGVVKDADVPVNPTGRVRGFAYITMEEDNAHRAMRELNGTKYDSGNLRIEIFHGEKGDKDYRFGGKKAKRRGGKGGGKGRGRGGSRGYDGGRGRGRGRF